MKEFSGIDHPAIAAENVETLAKWYCEVLGYKVHIRTERPVYLLEAPDKTMLEIMPCDHTQRPERTVHTPGLSHLALRVTNFEKASNWLNKHRVEWAGDEFVAIGNARIRNLYDPEKNVIQIVER
ncbi:MAG: VOC family protein [Prevotellaceae bacterium]|jgi:glyoxylase I family protein|nr:VOC family protein [Prevotellaceae bacterium]